MGDEVEIFRARIVALGLSHSAVDRMLGTPGYVNKLMNRKKRLGPKVTRGTARGAGAEA